MFELESLGGMAEVFSSSDKVLYGTTEVFSLASGLPRRSCSHESEST
jgi:hypothetical protein